MTSDDMLRLAQDCGATVYRNRANPHQPAIAFGDESWAKFCAAVEDARKQLLTALSLYEHAVESGMVDADLRAAYEFSRDADVGRGKA